MVDEELARQTVIFQGNRGTSAFQRLLRVNSRNLQVW